MRDMECREVREFLPAFDELAGSFQAAAVDRHLRGCPGCRTVLTQYRSLATGLASLREATADPPPWLLGTLTDAVAERVQQQAVARARRKRLTDPRVLGFGGAVVMAGLVSALVARSRRQRRRRSQMWRVLARA